MKLQSKEEISSVLGKYGLFESVKYKLLNKIGYLGGVQNFDLKLASKKRNEYFLTFEARPNGLEIVVTITFVNYRIGILNDYIEFFVIEPQQQIIDKKDKSIVGRALLGGVLLGPVGAIVGGMTGIGKKDVKLTKVDNIISLK